MFNWDPNQVAPKLFRTWCGLGGWGHRDLPLGVTHEENRKKNCFCSDLKALVRPLLATLARQAHAHGGAWVPRCLRPRLASPTPFSTLWLCWGSSVQPAVNGLPQDLCESLTLLITLKSGNITEFPWDR